MSKDILAAIKSFFAQYGESRLQKWKTDWRNYLEELYEHSTKLVLQIKRDMSTKCRRHLNRQFGELQAQAKAHGFTLELQEKPATA